MVKDSGVEVWVRGRHIALPAEAARQLHANAWVVRLPKSAEVEKALRLRGISMDTLPDDLGVILAGRDAFQVVPSAEDEGAVELTVLLG
jgi:hypothetical protein